MKETAFLNLTLYGIRMTSVDHMLQAPRIESLTGPEPVTLHTQMSIMSWFMQAESCELGKNHRGLLA